MTGSVSVIVPSYNAGATIGRCLEAAFASGYDDFEVVVVDDGSGDDSTDIAREFPCRLFRLDRHVGAAAARNIGASHSRGELLFFTDADCLLEEDTLAVASRTLASLGRDVILGGTYTPVPYDEGFFSLFQSVFVNHAETKRGKDTDYVATHAMVIAAETFRASQGFVEDFLPILEDVEFSHRLRRSGCRLVMEPAIQVRHIFDFSLLRSLHNALVKSMYWTIYSIWNGDLLVDSGAASVELKINVCAYFLTLLLLLVCLATADALFLAPVPLVLATSLYAGRGLLTAFFSVGGLGFAVAAALYYALLYPLAVGAGACVGAIGWLVTGRGRRRGR